MTRTILAASTLALALAACGSTGQDPAESSAPVAATSGAAPQSTQSVPAGEAAQDYRHDAYDNSGASVATTQSQDAALARCQGMDSMQRDACELQARQGLADQATSGQGADGPLPTDRVPPSNDATAAQDDDD